jgi:DNA-binding NarL/FixJ family response regulator
MPTLAILEDSALPLLQMREALSRYTQYQLLYTSTQGAGMKTWLNSHAVDILVADLGLPDMSGVEVIKHCKNMQPSTEIMVCTIFEDDEHLFTSLQSGANAYLLKSDIEHAFLDSLNQLLAGGAPMSPSIARRVLKQLQQPIKKTTAGDSNTQVPPLLTHKELDVLNLLMRGFKYSEIAATLPCSPHTVNTHIKSIYKKLQVSSKTEAVFEARQLNILPY